MALSDDTRKRISSLIESNRVMLFMKGTPEAPQCGFSATVVGILDGVLREYASFDVLEDPEVREGIKEYGSWPTIPQLYVEGELVGGADIVSDLAASGELHRRLGVPVPEKVVPDFTISNAAVNEVHRLAARLDVPRDHDLRLTIDARRRNQLGFSPRSESDVVVETNGLRIAMDPATAGRASGLGLDVVQTPSGPEFRIGRPGDPGIEQVSAQRLRELLDQGVMLIDVRTEAERQIARIEGARLLDAATVEDLEALDRDTPIAFHCHHGARSQAAAQHFQQLGFRRLYNLAGGIDAWSREVDPSVPRY